MVPVHIVDPRKVCRETSRIDDQPMRQANLLIPLNLISDQALKRVGLAPSA